MESTLFTAISVEELKNMFGQIIEDKISNLLKQNSHHEDNQKEKYATREEISDRLRISLPTLNKLTKEGIITGYRIGRRVLYNWNEVESVLQEITSTKYKRKAIK